MFVTEVADAAVAAAETELSPLPLADPDLSLSCGEDTHLNVFGTTILYTLIIIFKVTFVRTDAPFLVCTASRKGLCCKP